MDLQLEFITISNHNRKPSRQTTLEEFLELAH